MYVFQWIGSESLKKKYGPWALGCICIKEKSKNSGGENTNTR